MILQRDSSDDYATFGVLTLDDGRTYQTLELPWKNDAPNVSCIPAGTYTLKLIYSPHHGLALWEFQAVPNRSFCEIHSANLPSQLLGCVALGQTRGELNGQRAVLQSQLAVDDFMGATLVSNYRSLNSPDAVTAANVPDLTITIADVPTAA